MLLPDELVLMEECPSLVLSFGHQQRVRPSFGRHLLYAPVLAYYEFIIAIPGVCHRGFPDAGPFIFMPQLYLDKWIPIALGYLYGFAKRHASIRVTSEGYWVNDAAGRHTLVSLIYRPIGHAGGIETYPELASSGILDRMMMPLLGQTLWGSYLCSRMDWCLSEAVFQPVSAELIGGPLVPNFELGYHHINGIGSGSAAFGLQNAWRLSLPQRLTAFR